MGSADPRIQRGNILVADDDLPARQTLAALMERAGYEVRCAPSGQTALLFAREDPPDVILLDIRLPDVDGLQVCRFLKEDPRTDSIPVIFISALEDVEDKIKGFAAGGIDYIPKPVQVEEVLARVKTHLALRRLRNELEWHVGERTADLARAVDELATTNEQLRRESEQREQAERAVKDRLRFEQMLSELSARFVNIAPEKVDAEIERGLQQLLGFFEVDRCGLLRPSEDGTTFQITHSALAAGIPPVPAQEELPRELFPWAYPKIAERHEVISVSALEEMPAEASVDRRTYEEWGIQSHLNLPIVMTGSPVYIISINAVRKRRLWPEEYIPRLRLLGEIFVNALERRRARLELDERLRFEGLISDLSASFVNLTPDGVDAEVERWLRPITEFFAVDRCTIGIVSEDWTRTARAFQYCVEGVESGVASLSKEEVPWYLEQVIRGQPVVMNRVEDLPAEAERERQFCLANGLKSILSMPMVSTGNTLGFCALVAVRRERVWPEALAQRFRLVGEVFANALARKQSDQALQRAEMEHRTILDFTYDWEYWANPDGTLWYVSPSCERITGYTPLEFIHAPSLLRDIVVEEDREHWEARLGEAAGTPRAVEVQFRIRRRDGTIRWIDHVCRSVSAADGTFLGHRVSNRDATEHKRLDEELAARLREIETLKRRLEQENIYLREEAKLQAGHGGIVGESEAIRGILAQAEQVARTDSTVLILGETGTGKELLARAIHQLSARRDRALVTVNCASLPPTLIEAELFGREKGAYTGAMTRMAGRFEVADGSTLFLDEVGELPLEVQTKLLRVIEEGHLERLGSTKTVHVNIRLVAATNRDLAKDIQKGRFRKDLYYRLNVFPIVLPPLRERLEDIPLLVWAFVREFEKRMGKRIESIPKRVMEALQRHPWPGNARELRNVIEHAMIVSSGKVLDVHLPASGSPESHAAGNLEGVERRHILSVLEKTGWRLTGQGGAAELLGLKRTTLQSRMKKLGIKRPAH